jgi:isoquinoline 1-oxidoreductase beta subunit
VFAQFRGRLDEPGLVSFDEGDAIGTLAAGGHKQVLDVVYQLPYQSHAPMEPMSVTAQVTADRVDIWAGGPGPDGTLRNAATVAGMPQEKTFVYNTFVGGAFGGGARPRQSLHHAILVAKTLGGRPVKLLWTREQDITMDTYRPVAVARCRGAIGADGRAIAALYRVVTNRTNWAEVPVGRLETIIDGMAAWGFQSIPYGIRNQRAEIITPRVAVPPISAWRAPGHCNAAFIIESFIDELAHAAGQDPYKFRRALIVANPGKDPGFRHKEAWIKALDIAAEKSGWGTPLPRGRGRGIAIDDRRKHTHPEAQRITSDHSLVTVCATVAEVTVDRDGRLRVDRVVVAHDIGDGLINPEAVDRQIRGQFAWAMSSGQQEITIDRGRVVQTNFHNYPMVRLQQFPLQIDIHHFPKYEQIAGAGEEVIPSIMPAICNAIFAATGKRLRTLPLRQGDLQWG